jgi:predicted nucleic acid-binding protein
MRGLRLPAKTLCIAALNLFAERNISYADAFNAVYMQSKGITEVYSWDTDFDRIKGITRIEPAGVISSEQSPT